VLGQRVCANRDVLIIHDDRNVVRALY